MGPGLLAQPSIGGQQMFSSTGNASLQGYTCNCVSANILGSTSAACCIPRHFLHLSLCMQKSQHPKMTHRFTATLTGGTSASGHLQGRQQSAQAGLPPRPTGSQAVSSGRGSVDATAKSLEEYSKFLPASLASFISRLPPVSGIYPPRIMGRLWLLFLLMRSWVISILVRPGIYPLELL